MGFVAYGECRLSTIESGTAGIRLLTRKRSRVAFSGLFQLYEALLPKSKLLLKFAQLYSSSDDPLKRNLRPLHLERKWSVAIKAFSQRAAGLRVLICGPKSSGKSTLSRYLLNHLLSPTPQEGRRRDNTDGVAFLDLDPGQPEFSPMGQIYLAHLRNPLFGPPFSHPTLAGSHNGTILRAHHIGATSPKEDPDHYVLAAMNLMDCYQTLLNSHPQCPLIINYPGWIFGPGLEIAIWFVKSLGISDVVYMSEKGPDEVIGQLSQAAREAGVALTTLPSQPISFMTRSSSQLRSMQIQSYFHISHPREAQSPIWSQIPLSRQKPIYVNYAGERQGILGVMVQGNQHDPNLLFNILHGAIVGIVVVENLSAIARNQEKLESGGNLDDHDNENMCEVEDDIITREDTRRSDSLMEPFISRTPREGLPYLFVGNGSCTPLDPEASHSLGLAWLRAIDVSARRIELITPIPVSGIHDALQHSQGLILVRGQLDDPDWTVSEDHHIAQTERR
jgi:polynucleotide 5'-hydroxyl-kinase GRC3/NOL9